MQIIHGIMFTKKREVNPLTKPNIFRSVIEKLNCLKYVVCVQGAQNIGRTNGIRM